MTTIGVDQAPKPSSHDVNDETDVVAATSSPPTFTAMTDHTQTSPASSAAAPAVLDSESRTIWSPPATTNLTPASLGDESIPTNIDSTAPGTNNSTHTTADDTSSTTPRIEDNAVKPTFTQDVEVASPSAVGGVRSAGVSLSSEASSPSPATYPTSTHSDRDKSETEIIAAEDDVSVQLRDMDISKPDESHVTIYVKRDDAVLDAVAPAQTIPSRAEQSDDVGEDSALATGSVETLKTPVSALNSQDDRALSDTVQETSKNEVVPPVPRKETALPIPPRPSAGPSSASSAHTLLVSSKRDSSQERNTIAKAFGVAVEAAPSSSAQSIVQEPVSAAPATPAKGETSQARASSSVGLKVGKGPPPTTNPQEEKPFDFNIFLDQMKDPSARGVGEYVRSFIKGFAKKPYRTSDQIKLIFDFLEFVSTKMRQCSVWGNLSEAEFDNATEAMEKLVMNRLYGFTFTPAVAKEGKWTPQTDDLEKDRVLKERIELFDWVKEEHLDIPTGEHSKGFIDFAIQELLKINHYKAPRDKLICILNCCKVIFGLIRHLSSEENADTFIPILILIVLKGNPEHLISNVEYTGRFRNPDKLSSEAGYYLSSLMGATAFIETMDYSTLSNITQDEFERNVEHAVQRIGSQARPDRMPSSGTLAPAPRVTHSRTVSTSDPHAPPTAGEEAARALPGSASQGPNLAEDTKAFFQRTGEAARVGFTNSVGKPIGALGKLFGESLDGIRTPTYPGASAPGSTGGRTPNGADSPTPSISPGARKSVFSGFFGADQQTQEGQQQQQQQQGRSVSGFNPSSWSRSFRGGQDDEEPQTPSTNEARQGPFSSLIRNPAYTDALPPLRKIGQAPDAPKARKGIAQRGDSIDPFDYPDLGSTSTASGEGGSSEDIGTPSDGSDDEAEADQSALQRARRKLPDLGAFVPFLASDSPNSTPVRLPPHQQQQRYSGLSQRHDPPARSQELTRGPDQARPAYPGDSSFLQPSSDRGMDRESSPSLLDVSADMERVHEEQMEAGVETLANVFPDTEEEVRRMILEACNGDVGQAIDRLLEMA